MGVCYNGVKRAGPEGRRRLRQSPNPCMLRPKFPRQEPARQRWSYTQRSNRIMESNAPQANQPEVVHHALTITLGAPGIDPGHINPDFLKYNGIVDSDWQVERPVIIEPGVSLVRYDNGLAFSAGESYIRVVHTGSSLTRETIFTADVMQRYLEVAPWPVEYHCVMTDWRGIIRFNEDGLDLPASPLHSLAQKAQFGGIVPSMQARAAYGEDSDKSITVYLSELVEENTITGIQLNIHIHRDMDDVLSEERREFINSTLKNWQDDIKELEDLASRFYFIYTQKEG